MNANNKTYQPVQAVTIKTVEDIPAFRFVSHLGSICANEGKALGVTETDWVSGENEKECKSCREIYEKLCKIKKQNEQLELEIEECEGRIELLEFKLEFNDFYNFLMGFPVRN